MVIVLNADEDGILLRETVWELVAHQLIDNLLAVQSILLLAVAIDRYLNLFNVRIYLKFVPFVSNVINLKG